MTRDQSPCINAPSFTRKQIISLAEEVTFKYANCVGQERLKLGISFDAIYNEVIYPEYEIILIENEQLGEDDSGAEIQGRFDPLDNTAYVTPQFHPENHDPRRAFTCFHEVGGHGILQGNWLRSELRRLRRTSPIITTEASMSRETENQLEQQANLFAAHLAAPTWLVVYAIRCAFSFHEHTRFRYIGPGKYTFCVRRSTRPLTVRSFDDCCRKIAYYIKGWFGGLSVEALSYRVAECPLVRDETRQVFSLYRKAPVSSSLVNCAG